MNRTRRWLAAAPATAAAIGALWAVASWAGPATAPAGPTTAPDDRVVQIGPGSLDGRPQLGRSLIQVAGDEYVLLCSSAGQAGLRTTTDGGAHWSGMSVLGGPGDVVNAAFDGESRFYVVYSEWFTGTYVQAEKKGLAVHFRKLTRTGPGQSAPGPQRAVPGSHDNGSVAVEPTGRVWVSYCRIDDRGYQGMHAGGNIKARSTTDDGATWSPVSFLHLTGSGDSSVKHALMEWQGRPTILWGFWDVGGMSWGYWDGSMWIKLRDLTPFLSPGLTYSACQDGRGRLHLAFNHYGRNLYHMVYDGGAWSRPVRIYQGEVGWGIPCLASDGARVWCVWPLKDQVLIKRFADDTWEAEPRVEVAGQTCERPSLPMRIAPGTRAVPLVWFADDRLKAVTVELK